VTLASHPSSPTDQPVKSIPSWLIIFIIALCLGGGGWLAYSQWFSAPAEGSEIDIGPVSDQYIRRGRPVPVAASLNKDGINPGGVGFYRVQQGDFYMVLAPSETTFAPITIQSTKMAASVPQNDRVLIQLCRQTANGAVASTLKLTPDQIKQLAAIRKQLPAGMTIADADRDKLRQMWKDWNIAKDPGAKKAIETPMLAALKDIGTRSVEPTKKAYAGVAAQIRKVVTDEQIKTFRATRGG
jgi:hypothetical protein